jgi:hypothetical protein
MGGRLVLFGCTPMHQPAFVLRTTAVKQKRAIRYVFLIMKNAGWRSRSRHPSCSALSGSVYAAADC